MVFDKGPRSAADGKGKGGGKKKGNGNGNGKGKRGGNGGKTGSGKMDLSDDESVIPEGSVFETSPPPPSLRCALRRRGRRDRWTLATFPLFLRLGRRVRL